MKFVVVSVLLFAIVFDVAAPCGEPSPCPAIEINAAAIKANADNLNTQLGNLGEYNQFNIVSECWCSMLELSTTIV